MEFQKVLLIVCFLKCFYLVRARQFRVTDQVYLDIRDENKDLGRVVIGLFGDLAPKAVKNFKVLATNGINGMSYKGTSFNRIIKRFMIQGGDVVSDDGTGSVSIYGESFEDENLDTQHSSAGFVSMANKGRNTNGCQFIITTIGTPWLDNLHTIVGKHLGVDQGVYGTTDHVFFDIRFLSLDDAEDGDIKTYQFM
ncbi:peptidyl-prolyl cis-trans isomerase, rhodopsin-specific isozyme-like isoform X3 [Achroia grisella]|uniref:peptidyl-prolyl cis-trans isomerase, rhodopsin-specific isozyme-like isoform X3 n=1 Tax=Achroia grisella TaxID=688607 RepID=UPI0027D2968D|nr:peptidyl-prolyl cis-trans isomerase, rhodopsin-specific isozyme-like isoform X3 [Achroia grisella]